MMRSASCSTRLRLCASGTTIANSSPPMRPTWPSAATSSTSRLATARSTASPLGWPNVSLTGLKPSRSRNRIAHGTLPVVASRSESPSSWRTRPRLGRPDSTSTLARWVRRSCVWRISVMSEPTPRKPSKRPAVSRIGSPGHRHPTRPARGFHFHLERIERLLVEQHPAELGMAAEQRRKRMAKKVLRRRAEQRAHPRADIGDAVLAIDRPQPADAALLIFLEQQAGAFALAADVGIHRQLMKRPAGDGQHAEDRDAHGEDDRQHVVERHGVATDQQRADDAPGEGNQPGGRAGRNHDQAQGPDAETGHDRGGNHLRARIEHWKAIKRNAEPDRRAKHDVADHQPLRHSSAGPPDAADRLGPGELHGDEIDASHGDRPGQKQGRRHRSPEIGDHHQRGDHVRRGEEGRELGARNELDVP